MNTSNALILGSQNAAKSLTAGVSPHTPLDSLSGFKGPTSKAPTSKGREGRRRRQNYLWPGGRNPRAATELTNVYIKYSGNKTNKQQNQDKYDQFSEILGFVSLCWK